MWHNPEFQRNRLLQVSPLNLLLIPLIAFFVGVMPFQMEDNINDQLDILHGISLGVFLFAAFLVGGFQAANAIHKEIKARTWNNQRLTLLTPIEMLIGKWAGPTFYSWIVSLFAWVIFVLISLTRAETGVYLVFSLTLILSAVFVQFLSGVAGLVVAKRYSESRNAALPASMVIAVATVIPILIGFFSFKDRIQVEMVPWWGVDFPFHYLGLAFSILLVLAAFLWFLFEMRKELNFPLHWSLSGREIKVFNPSFLVLLLAFSGLGTEPEEVFAIALSMSIVLLYLSVISQSPERVRFYWKQRSFAFFKEILIRNAFIWSVLVVILGLSFGIPSEEDYWIYGVSFLGVALRDTSVYFFLALSSRVKKPEVLWYVYLAVLHFLIAPMGAALAGPGLRSFLFPMSGEIQLSSAICSLILGVVMALGVSLKRRG